MYIRLQRKDFLPVLSLCQNLISHFNSQDFTFLTPARTATIVATTKICIELLDCRTGPDPLAAGRGVRTPKDLLWRGGACCNRHKVNLWAESKLGLKQKVKKACKSVPTWAFGPHWPCILRFSSRLEIESDRDKIRIRLFPKSLDYKYVPYVIHEKKNVITSRNQQLSAHCHP